MQLNRNLFPLLFCGLISCLPASAQLDLDNYQLAGPYEVVARDGEFRSSKGGSERDMKAAWLLSGQGRHAEARRIIDAYAEKLLRLDGHDAPLCLIQGYWLCRSIMIERADSLRSTSHPVGPPSEESEAKWEAMLRRAFIPTMEQFEANSPYANGNWGAIVNRFRMACALAMRDSVMYRASVAFFLDGYDNGSLRYYVGETGQCQETGRDQAHVQLGLGALCDICEMAWQQGDDLWGAMDNRLMKGLEYTAQYNLGHDVPFQTWKDLTGLYCNWTVPGAMGRGVVRDIYRAAYAHYTGVRRLKMPFTKRILQLQEKARAKGRMKYNIEAEYFQLDDVAEGTKLHSVLTYPAPQGAPLKSDYDVYVQPRGSREWTRVDTYMAKVNASVGGGKHRVSEISYAMFDFTGDCFVRVVTRKRKFRAARIRPDYRGTIANVQNDSTVQFILFQPENLSVEFSDGTGFSLADNLLLFTSQPPMSREEAEAQAKASGRRFIYYPPGLYTQADIDEKLNRSSSEAQADIDEKLNSPSAGSQADIDEKLNSPSGEAQADIDEKLNRGSSEAQADIDAKLSSPSGDGQRGPAARSVADALIYLAPGSYFQGTFGINDTQNVSIIGRGIARPRDGYEGAHVYRSRNVVIDGLVVNTCPIGESHDVSLHDVRCISHPSWGDGLNVFGGSSDIQFERVFCRTSDDCTTAYATRKGFRGSTRNVTMRNAVLWADVAHAIFIGIHGDAERGDTIESIRYENIDILGQAEPQVDYQGSMAINCGDNNLVRDVVFDNIRVEEIESGSLVQVKVGFNQKYCAAPGRSVENITFRNVRYNGRLPQSLSVINGYSPERGVHNVLFEHLRINGRLIHDSMPGKPAWYATADYVPMFVGNNVENVVFSP